MKRQIHILNGDALKQQLPESIEGEIIVMRECLVDGSVQGETLNEFFQSRAHFICQNYAGVAEKDYYKKSKDELLKIKDISEEADINVWFEDDLFCQVNFWFVLYLLSQSQQTNPIFLIRPNMHNQYGFGGLNHKELKSLQQNRHLITQIDQIASLWTLYQNNDIEKMKTVAMELQSCYPFILTAVNAHIARIPCNNNPGKPTQTLLQIMKDLKTDDFAIVFKEFSKRECIYGFGDTQVKRLLNRIQHD